MAAKITLILACLVCGLFLAQTPYAGAAAKTDRFRQPFSRYANQEPIQAVLLDFAQTQGYSAVVVPGVEGVISGHFDAVQPLNFLNGIRSAFGVSWYTLGNTVYFYPEAHSTRMFISPKATQPKEMFASLQSSGVLSPELSAHLAPGGKMIIVYGPPNYLNEVRDAVAAFEETLISNTDMRVFPLRYAWADDITITSMDNTVTVPGVASILRAAVTKDSAATTKVTANTATVGNLLGSGLAKQGSAAIAPAPKAVVPSGAQVGGAFVNIMADPRVNAVLVTDAVYRMPYYEKAIADLDKPVELVEIHAAIVDIDVNFTKELGVSYQGTGSAGKYWGGTGSLSSDGASFVPSPPAGEMPGPGLNLSTIYSFGSDYFIARVRALEQQGEARVLGRPSVLTVDNVQATLENTSTYYIKIEGYQAVDLFKVEAGTVLKVTPHIIKHKGRPDTIKLAVTVQDNQDTDQTVTVGEIPPVKQTKINTQAIVGAGQSLLIGGYYYEEARDTDNGIPILMNIPLLGYLFKDSSTETRRMERLIMITPRVIKLDELPSVPERVDEKSFHLDPRQSNYEYREPAERPSRGGCSRSAASFDPDDTGK
jgi:type III secretion protein C